MSKRKRTKYRDAREAAQAKYASKRRFILAHPELSRRRRLAQRLKHEYGLSIADYERMHAEQNGVCRICRKPETAIHNGKPLRLAVDHNHKTGEVRSLLCNRCNPAVGLVLEDPLIARALAEYLERFSVEGEVLAKS